MAHGVLESLATAIGYPEPVPDGTVSHVFVVDGAEIRARVVGNRLLLVRSLSEDPADLPKLAEYAAGRLLREDAVLAWEAESGSAVIWRDAPADAGQNALKTLFERFADSADWWDDRVRELHAPVSSEFPEMVIRP